MKSLKGTKTADNLARAFAGESQARNRYTFYKEVAEKEGYYQIAEIFKTIAHNERAHGKVFFDLLVQGGCSGNINVEAGYPCGLGNTLANLMESAKGEHEEHSEVYPAFARIAKEEGFPEVEKAFNYIANIEQQHENEFRKLHEMVNSNQLYSSPTKQCWKCENCGYIYEGTEVPTVCPNCHYPKGYFKKTHNQ